jgi:ATP-dependent protease ClpP protease subunit
MNTIFKQAIVLVSAVAISTSMLYTAYQYAEPEPIDANSCVIYNGEVNQQMVDSVKKQLLGKVSKPCINLTTYGGELESMVDVIALLRSITGSFDIIVPKYVMSAGAIILAHADHIYINSPAVVLFHTPRIADRDGLLVTEPKFNTAFNKYLLNSTSARKALTEEQKFAYINGMDIILTSTEIRERIGHNRVKIL